MFQPLTWLNVNGSVIGITVLGVHARMSSIVKESTEGEFKKGVHRMLAIVQRVIQLVLIATIAQLIRNNRIEIGRVRSVADLWDVRRRFVAKATLEIDAFKERVRFQFTPRSLIGRRAQAHDQIRRFRRQVRNLGYTQRRRPIDDLSIKSVSNYSMQLGH